MWSRYIRFEIFCKISELNTIICSVESTAHLFYFYDERPLWRWKVFVSKNKNKWFTSTRLHPWGLFNSWNCTWADRKSERTSPFEIVRQHFQREFDPNIFCSQIIITFVSSSSSDFYRYYARTRYSLTELDRPYRCAKESYYEGTLVYKKCCIEMPFAKLHINGGNSK